MLVRLALLLGAFAGLAAAQIGCGAGTMLNTRTNLCEVYDPDTSTPLIDAIDDNMVFLTKSGKRIGYKYGNMDTVYFDELTKTQQQIATAIQTAYVQGKDIGKAQAQLEAQKNGTSVQQQLLNYVLETELETQLDTLTQSLISKIDAEAAARTLDRKGLENALNSSISSVKVTMGANYDALASLIATLGLRMENVEKFASTQGESVTYWVDNQFNNEVAVLTRIPANRAPKTIKLLGVGFDKYYHPTLQQALSCVFTNKNGDTPANITKSGHVVLQDSRFYHVECATPGEEVRVQTEYKITLLNFDGVSVIPFKGSTSRDTLRMDYYWSSIDSSTGRILFSGVGLAPNTTVSAYDCVIAGKDTAGAAKTFELRNGRVNAALDTVDCGVIPTGLQVTDGKSSVTIELYEVNLGGYKVTPLVTNGVTVSNAVVLNMCLNGVKDGTETDIDCGGPSCQKCRMNQICSVDSDCGFNGPTFCYKGKCYMGDGKSAGSPGETCKSILKHFPTSASGIYFIQGIDFVLGAPIQVQCFMDKGRDGGGWTLILKNYYDVTFDNALSEGLSQCTAANVANCNAYCPAGSLGSVNDGLTQLGQRYKLDDDVVRRGIIGSTNNFDVMVDQAWHNHYYSSGNFEYVTMIGYTATWRFDMLVATSSTPVSMRSYRISDNKLAWEGEIKCGIEGGIHPNAKGINCYGMIRNNPAGGAGCAINMGTATNSDWHTIQMFNHNSDSYLYVCCGAQHSSGTSMNHRWWFRDRLP